jgi:hypothetical protein
MHVKVRLALLSTLAVSAVLAGCATTNPRPIASFPGPTQRVPTPPNSTSAPVAVTDGTVLGGMYRCSGLPLSVSGPPTLIAGSVSVFRGPNAGLPDEIVNTDGTYALELAPGPYVLVGHATGSNLAPPMARVEVSSGSIIHQDLDYEGCR